MKKPAGNCGWAAPLVAVSILAFCAHAFAGAKRPMALLIMVDGMRADAVEVDAMPNLLRLKRGAWRKGYKAAWSLTGQSDASAAPSSAPNHVSIATGVNKTKHGVAQNSNLTENAYDYATYPTWLKRVVNADSSRKALFVYSWKQDAYLGPAEGVEFIGGTIDDTAQTDAINAPLLAARLASDDAPDATMYFIDTPDHVGHGVGDNFYPMSAAYRKALADVDFYIGMCLDAIASRATFEEEDWLILVTSDHGGYSNQHGTITKGRQANTIPVVIAGTGVSSGRIPGSPYNYDVTASALAHFGVSLEGLDAARRDQSAEVVAPGTLSEGFIAYRAFDSDETSSGKSSSDTAVTDGGKLGKYLNIASGGYVKLEGTDTSHVTYADANKSFTATIWVKMDNPPTSGDPVIIGNKDWGGVKKGVILFSGVSSQVKWTIDNNTVQPSGVMLNAGDGSDTGRIDIGPMKYEEGVWTFYAVSCDANGIFTLYQGRQDGTLDWVCSAPFSGFSLESGYPFYIGTDGDGNYNSKFVGGVDDFGLWSRTLSIAEVRAVYEAGRNGISLGDLTAPKAKSVTLASRLDLSGIDAANLGSGSSYDLNGQTMRLATSTIVEGISVTDSSADQDGTLVVKSGTFKMASAMTGNIYIASGATLDQYGYDLSANPVVLDGGTLTNTKGANSTLPMYLNLTADSGIIFANVGGTHDMSVPKGAEWNLGGCTLNVVLDGFDPDLCMEEGETISNGTLKVAVNSTAHDNTGRGWVQFANLNGKDGLRLDLGNSILRLKHHAPNMNSTVCDFTCRPPRGETIYSGNQLEIYGVYKPQSTDGFNIKMMDGSTLDLSDQNVAWNCKFRNSGGYAKGSSTECKVSFAAGATVNVNLGGRADLKAFADSGRHIILWAENAVPDVDLTAIVDELASNDYAIANDGTGAWVRRMGGLVIIVNFKEIKRRRKS